jgi:hypothetical protein
MSSTVWRSSHPVISPRRVHAWRRVVGPPDTVAVHREWAAGRCYTIVACYEWIADRRCLVAVVQTPCPHVLLAFNMPPAACLPCVQYRPCRVVSWKIPGGRS